MISYLTETPTELPDIHKTDDLDACKQIVLIDTSWTPTPEWLEQLFESVRFHIACITSPDILCWDETHLSAFLEKCSRVFAASKYLQNQVSPFIRRQIDLLHLPVCEKTFKPAKTKEKRLIAVADSRADNIETLQAFNNELTEDWELVILPRNSPDIPYMLSTAWGYLNMSRSSEYPFSFIQAGLSGCFNFVWHYHPFADAYPVYRFEDVDEGLMAVQEILEKAGEGPNIDIRKHIISLHSPAVFKKNLQNIINPLIF